MNRELVFLIVVGISTLVVSGLFTTGYSFGYDYFYPGFFNSRILLRIQSACSGLCFLYFGATFTLSGVIGYAHLYKMYGQNRIVLSFIYALAGPVLIPIMIYNKTL